MKSLFIIAAMAFMVSNAAFAQKSDAEFDKNTTAVDYSFKVNNRSISKYLKLEGDQEEKMAYICDRFDNDLARVGHSKEEKRADRFMNALSYNLSAAHQTLSAVQYHKYLVLLNSSLKNKGLDMYVANRDMAFAE